MCAKAAPAFSPPSSAPPTRPQFPVARRRRLDWRGSGECDGSEAAPLSYSSFARPFSQSPFDGASTLSGAGPARPSQGGPRETWLGSQPQRLPQRRCRPPGRQGDRETNPGCLAPLVRLSSRRPHVRLSCAPCHVHPTRSAPGALIQSTTRNLPVRRHHACSPMCSG